MGAGGDGGGREQCGSLIFGVEEVGRRSSLGWRPVVAVSNINAEEVTPFDLGDGWWGKASDLPKFIHNINSHRPRVHIVAENLVYFNLLG
jgi:hypothetical protein